MSLTLLETLLGVQPHNESVIVSEPWSVGLSDSETLSKPPERAQFPGLFELDKKRQQAAPGLRVL